MLLDRYCKLNENKKEITAGPKAMSTPREEKSMLQDFRMLKLYLPVDLYVEDVMKIYYFLKERGVGTMIWADKLIDCTGTSACPTGTGP